MINKSYAVAAVLSGCLLAAPLSRVSAADLPAPMQAALLTKILGQCKTLVAKGKINIALYCPDGSCKAVSSELSKLKDGGANIGGVPFTVQNAGDLASVGADVLYASGVGAGSVSAVTQKKKILSVTGVNADEMVQGGVAMGLALDGDKPKILANAASLGKEGAEFPAQFLALAKIY